METPYLIGFASLAAFVGLPFVGTVIAVMVLRKRRRKEAERKFLAEQREICGAEQMDPTQEAERSATQAAIERA